MNFQRVREAGPTIDGHRFPDRTAIYARGEIVEDDVERFLDALNGNERDEYGNVRVYLDSPGGNVHAALEMVKAWDFLEVTAVVRNGDTCISACASILFLSARVHFLETGGLLGMHTCRLGNIHPSSLCNEIIADNALYHGTPVGSVEAALKSGMQGDDEVLYFDAPTACGLGLCGPPIYDPTLAIPSFDCGRPEHEYQRVVCGHGRLARYDASIAQTRTLLQNILPNSDKAKLQNEIEYWHDKLRTCDIDIRCLTVEYSVFRLSIRSNYTLSLFTSIANNSPDSEHRRKSMTIFNYCKDMKTCPRPFLLDRTYELFTENNAMRLLLSVGKVPNAYKVHFDLSREGSMDCMFVALCDPRIRTFNLLGVAPDWKK